MDVETCIGQLEQLLADARSVPLSGSVMVPRRDLETALRDLRAALPEELRQSRWIIKEREELLRQAAREAEQISADAVAEQQRLVQEAEILRVAEREAERIVEDARETARVLRLESEDYVDAKLAGFEVVLNRTLRTVAAGRERLRGRLATDQLATGNGDQAEGDHDAGEQDAGHQPTASPLAAEPRTQLFDHEQGA